ncbi:MLO-like protein 1 [Ancistrocladus abbreviatus]
MIRALEDDFKHVVGISWYLWVFVVVFLLLNVNGWHAYFWIAFIPFIARLKNDMGVVRHCRQVEKHLLASMCVVGGDSMMGHALLLAVGTKLEHVIAQLAHEPSDDHFRFNRPQIVLFLIHFILFQNAFEIAYLFWIWVQYGFNFCIMGKVAYIAPRLIIGVIIQVLCSYSILPLYAIVNQEHPLQEKTPKARQPAPRHPTPQEGQKTEASPEEQQSHVCPIIHSKQQPTAASRRPQHQQLNKSIRFSKENHRSQQTPKEESEKTQNPKTSSSTAQQPKLPLP